MSTEELLDAWRDATRAAELAERLATNALEAVERADQDLSTAHTLAALAEEAAASTERAAQAAREAVRRAHDAAAGLRDDLDGADRTASNARTVESGAKDLYHAAEADAHRRHETET